MKIFFFFSFLRVRVTLMLSLHQTESVKEAESMGLAVIKS